MDKYNTNWTWSISSAFVILMFKFWTDLSSYYALLVNGIFVDNVDRDSIKGRESKDLAQECHLALQRSLDVLGHAES